MHCRDCGHWLLEEWTIYDGDGSKIIKKLAPGNQGLCNVLNQATNEDFGCLKFVDGTHIIEVHKALTPWQNWIMINCPDCNGTGSNSAACYRCAGTGKVRKYDDGYVGEERTRRHPKEAEVKKQEEDRATKLNYIEQKDGAIQS